MYKSLAMWALHFLSLTVGCILLAAGIYVLSRLNLFGFHLESAEAATLSGALIGAGAIFIGNQFNYSFQLLNSYREKNAEKDGLKTILMAEIQDLAISQINQLKHYIQFQELLDKGERVGCWSDKTYSIPDAFIFDSIYSKITIFDGELVRKLVAYYSGVSKTRAFISQATLEGFQKSLPYREELKRHIQENCAAATSLIGHWDPTVKYIQRDGSSVLLVELLENPKLLQSI